MTLAQYLRIARAQWLLIVAVTVLGAFGAAAYAWSQTPIYSASAQLFVTTSSGNADINTLSQGSTFTQQRVKSYAAAISSPDVLQPVIDELGLRETPQSLAKRVTASSPLDTVLLDVKVTDTSPARARDIANAIGQRFTAFVGALEVPSANRASPVKITVIKPAVLPVVPDSPRKKLALALGLLVGLGLGVGAAVLRDTLDQSIGTRHDAGEIAGAPVLSAIVEDVTVKETPLIVHDAFSPRAEAFRQLRTNIRFLSVDTEVRSLVVTSSVPGEGKSTTSANLAIAMAQSGERVVLIDADLRRPTIGDMFLLPGGVGLTSVLLGDVQPADAVQKWRDDLDLWVLASGPIPPNPSELIGSHRMVEIVDTLVEQGYMVIVDSPPLLPVTDATILARITAGAVVVAKVTSTRVDQLAAAADTLRAAGAPVLGVLVNRVPKTSTGYYSYGGYSSEGYRSATPPAAAPVAPAPQMFGPRPDGATSASEQPPAANGRKRRRAHAPVATPSPAPVPPMPHDLTRFTAPTAPAPPPVVALPSEPAPHQPAPHQAHQPERAHRHQGEQFPPTVEPVPQSWMVPPPPPRTAPAEHPESIDLEGLLRDLRRPGR
ncbi:MAG: polysaccharide biosynthesis tyrosine autokinase [Coriobacteriales bacterium]|nr:polysaccharide biosynthesis tyrosine autokinase [Coriobacteriales bacterium]